MMMRRGTANLPLHGGKAPAWLFQRMKRMAGAISRIIIYEHGQDEFLRRISDPFFFQAFGCVLGFDWHSSGLTTTVTGALKEALNRDDIGVKVVGGKGKASRRSLSEIEESPLSTSKIEKLKHASRMAAKVDNAVLQDGYSLYHHVMLFSEKGKWAVIQQGMDPHIKYARRYHWLSDNIDKGTDGFVNEPHSAVCCDAKNEKTLNMVSKESKEARKASVDLINDRHFLRSPQTTLADFTGSKKKEKVLSMPLRHSIIDMDRRNIETLRQAAEISPSSYEELLSIRGIGPKIIRSLALVSQLVYGSELSWQDPVRFSFAHGGKDGIPYPVDRKVMDRSIDILKSSVEETTIEERYKLNALRKLSAFSIG